jgi:hypothetical protein
MIVLALSAILVTGAQSIPAARAQAARAVGPTPPRIAFISGEVSFWRPGADDWVPAQVNTALAAGDALYVADGSNVELEIGSRAYVRAGSGTQLAVDSLETGYLQLAVTSGHCAADLQRLPEGQVVEIDTPHGAFTVERPGYYGVDVDDRTVFTTRRGGAATVVPAGGDERDIEPDQQVVLEGSEDSATVAVNAAPDADDWDRWNFDRTARRAERPRSAEYVPQPVAGVDDLDDYGDWRETPRYGHVWVPHAVASDWAPYSTGRWVYDPYYEWTWVDDAPWGWAPYHYGRWVWADDYWAWAPGPVLARPVYSPALVAFFGGGHGGVSVTVGAPFVSWVALGWGEPVVPWWGPHGFVGRPYWGGWGGPRVVNNVVINNRTTIVNVTTINRFSNVGVRNAVIGVQRERFGHGRQDPVRVRPEQTRELQLVRGQIGVRPVPASLSPREGRGAQPPDRIRNRRVVGTRAPQDPSPRLRAAGIETKGRPARPVETRVVQPSRGRDAGRDERRRGVDRTTPPPAPGVGGGGPEERGRKARGTAEGGAANERGDRERGPANLRGTGSGNDRGGTNVERGGPAAPPPGNVGGPAEERGGRRGMNERERGKGAGGKAERGQGVAPPPPPVDNHGGPVNERGGRKRDRGGNVDGARPKGDRGAPNLEPSGRQGAPPPPPMERAPAVEHKPAMERQQGRNRGQATDRGADVERGRGRARENVERPVPPAPPQVAPPAREMQPHGDVRAPREVQPRNDRGRERTDRGEPNPRGRERVAPEPPHMQILPPPVPKAPQTDERQQRGGDGRQAPHGRGRDDRQPGNPQP